MLAAEPSAAVCFSGFDRCYSEDVKNVTGALKESGAKSILKNGSDAARLYLTNTGLFICSFALFRRSDLAKTMENGELFHEDLQSIEYYEFFIRFLAVNDAVIVDAPLGIYRLQSGRLSQNFLNSWSNRLKGLERLLASPASRSW